MRRVRLGYFYGETTVNTPVSEEVLLGADRIAIELFGSADATAVRRVYFWKQRHRAPFFRVGRTLACRRSELRRYFEELPATRAA
jgi:hypothetical protein